jgi:hypothetical protein
MHQQVGGEYWGAPGECLHDRQSVPLRERGKDDGSGMAVRMIQFGIVEILEVQEGPAPRRVRPQALQDWLALPADRSCHDERRIRPAGQHPLGRCQNEALVLAGLERADGEKRTPAIRGCREQRRPDRRDVRNLAASLAAVRRIGRGVALRMRRRSRDSREPVPDESAAAGSSSATSGTGTKSPASQRTGTSSPPSWRARGRPCRTSSRTTRGIPRRAGASRVCVQSTKIQGDRPPWPELGRWPSGRGWIICFFPELARLPCHGASKNPLLRRVFDVRVVSALRIQKVQPKKCRPEEFSEEFFGSRFSETRQRGREQPTKLRRASLGPPAATACAARAGPSR